MMFENLIALVLFSLAAVVMLYFILKSKKKDNDNDENKEPTIPTPNAKWKDDSTVFIDTGSTSFEKEISVTGDTFVTVELEEGDKEAIKIEPESGQNLDKVKVTINENNADDSRSFKLTIKNE